MPTPLKDVFVISEREGEENKLWARIGVAFMNKDESWNVVLDAVPITGRLHIRDRVSKKPEHKKGEWK